jgi:polyisoprenoid-binding protein YceI
MVVATFRGRFEDFDATLTADEAGNESLSGVVQVDSIEVKDENLKAHLGSPDFFDLERYPEIRFDSTSIEIGEGGEVKVVGDLTIKGQTHRVESTGTISGPAVTFGDVTKIGLTLETVVDRTQYGLNWNAPLPKGGVALANDVKLTVELELAREEA